MSRNVGLTKEAGRLRRLGRSPEEIESELLNHPGRNGLPPAEIGTIARSIGAKPPGPRLSARRMDGCRPCTSLPIGAGGRWRRSRPWALSPRVPRFTSP